MSDIDFEELDRAVNSLMEKRGEKMAAKEESAAPAMPSVPVDSTAPAAVPAEPVTSVPAPVQPAVADDQTVSNSSAPEPVTPVAPEPVVPPVEVVHDTTAPAEASTVPAAATDATADVAPAEPVTPAPVEMPATSPAPVSEPAPAAATSGFPTEAPAAEPETAIEKEPVGADVSPAPGEAAETPTPETASPAPTISKKPTGRFMDVVHPSSDMKTQRPAVSRTATIQPLSSGYMAPSGAVGGQQSVNAATEEATPTDMSLTDKISESLTDGQEPVRRRPARLVIEPDPAHVAEGLTEENLSLDVKDLPDYESIAGEAEGATDSEFVEEGLKLDDFPVDSFDEAAFAAEMSESSLETPAAEAASVQDTDEPADTAVATETTSPAPEVVTHEVAESEKPAEPEAREEETTLSTEPSLPEEPPVAVESADAGVAETSAATDVDMATPPKRPLEPELDAELLAIEATETVAPLPPADVAKPETGDVPQQYQAADDIAPQPEPMFDAAASQPATQELEHKEKKSSGWGVFFLIILCALVGVAGGVAAHFFLLQ